MINTQWWQEAVQKDWVEGSVWTEVFSKAIDSTITSEGPTQEQLTK